MKSLISRFLSRKRTEAPVQHMRLCLARFRHLLRLYGQIIALCADAADKQSGQYVFDKAYVISLIDRAFEAIEGMIYDLNALAGQRYLGLYENAEAIRSETTEMVKSESAAFPASGEHEEIEYRLLRKVGEALSRPDGPAITSFLGMSRFAVIAAGDSIVELTKSLNFPRQPTDASSGGLFPFDASIVDLIGIPGEAGRSVPRSRPSSTVSTPAREFLAGFFSPAVWKDTAPGSAVRSSANLVVYQLEESMSAVIASSVGNGLIDVFLGCSPEANSIYCRLPSASAPSLAEGILSKLGFFISSAEHELTGWIAAQPSSEMIIKLKMIAKLSAFLLHPSSVAAGQMEEEVAGFLRMHA